MTMEDNNFLEIAETAKLLSISPSTVRRMFDAGFLSGFRLPGGNHRRIARASIDEFLRRQTQIEERRKIAKEA